MFRKVMLLPLSVIYNRSIKCPDFAPIQASPMLYNFGRNNKELWNKAIQLCDVHNLRRTNQVAITHIIKIILDESKFVKLRTKLHDLIHFRRKNRKYSKLVNTLLNEPHTDLDKNGFPIVFDKIDNPNV